MLTVFKDNPVLAELDIFVTQPDQQWLLLDNLIAYTHDILKQQPGYMQFIAAWCGLRVVNYVQWQNQVKEAYINNRDIALATKITGFFAPDSHLYDIFEWVSRQSNANQEWYGTQLRYVQIESSR